MHSLTEWEATSPWNRHFMHWKKPQNIFSLFYRILYYWPRPLVKKKEGRRSKEKNTYPFWIHLLVTLNGKRNKCLSSSPRKFRGVRRLESFSLKRNRWVSLSFTKSPEIDCNQSICIHSGWFVHQEILSVMAYSWMDESRIIPAVGIKNPSSFYCTCSLIFQSGGIVCKNVESITRFSNSNIPWIRNGISFQQTHHRNWCDKHEKDE